MTLSGVERRWRMMRVKEVLALRRELAAAKARIRQLEKALRRKSKARRADPGTGRFKAKRTSTGQQISPESVKNDPSRQGSLLHNNLESTMEVTDEVPAHFRYA